MPSLMHLTIRRRCSAGRAVRLNTASPPFVTRKRFSRLSMPYSRTSYSHSTLLFSAGL